MYKKKIVVFVGFLLAVSLLHLQASVILDVRLRVYEGLKEGAVKPLRVVTSSFLQSTVSATIQTEFELEKEREKIKRVFNLQDVDLLTEADLKVGDRTRDVARHFFRLNGKGYNVMIRLIEWKGMGEFVVIVSETVQDKSKNILTTGITLPGGNAAVFGFEDKEGKPYFLSFHVSGPEGMLLPPPPPPPKRDKDLLPPPLPPAKKIKDVPLPPPPPAKTIKDVPLPPPPPTEAELKAFAKGAVQAVGEIRPPKLIKEVVPIYPELARKEGVSGIIVLGVRTDVSGRVTEVKVLRSIPLLDQAAVDAVRQWIYEPKLIEGKPTPVVFSVTITFRLR
jgi:TonB family protein